MSYPNDFYVRDVISEVKKPEGRRGLISSTRVTVLPALSKRTSEMVRFKRSSPYYLASIDKTLPYSLHFCPNYQNKTSEAYNSIAPQYASPTFLLSVPTF